MRVAPDAARLSSGNRSRVLFSSRLSPATSGPVRVETDRDSVLQLIIRRSLVRTGGPICSPVAMRNPHGYVGQVCQECRKCSPRAYPRCVPRKLPNMATERASRRTPPRLPPAVGLSAPACRRTSARRDVAHRHRLPPGVRSRASDGRAPARTSRRRRPHRRRVRSWAASTARRPAGCVVLVRRAPGGERRRGQACAHGRCERNRIRARALDGRRGHVQT
jgi:hypothetical protein